MADHADRRQGRPPAQPEEHRRRHPPRQAGRHHRPVRLGQVVARLRHDLRRGPAPLRRVAVGLRAPVPGADGQAGRRLHRAASRRRSRSTRRAPATTRARPSARSPRSTTTCGCSTPASVGRTARSAAARSSSRRSSRSWTPSWRCPPGTRLMILAPVVAGPQGRAPQRLRGRRARPASSACAWTARSATSSDEIELDRVQEPHASRSSSTAWSCPSRRGRRRTRRRRQPHRRLRRAGAAARRRHGARSAPQRRRGAAVLRALRLRLRHQSAGEIAPRNFSFNSPHGACPTCTGLGSRLEIDPSWSSRNPRTVAGARAPSCPGSAAPAARPTTSRCSKAWPRSTASR